ncbi:MAG: putative Type secretion system protein [Candidatus Saccharibacteria bacterium]|nr:putative Type secretion system protein [Candidatus Saccharibacteria bacterium]
MTRRGFTIVELIITITIMGILLTLAVVNIGSTQMNARDEERKADIEAIASNLEAFYTGGTDGTVNFARYPSLGLIGPATTITTSLRDANIKSFLPPGTTDVTQTFLASTNAGSLPAIQTTAGVLPQPTKDQYVYQPIKSDGTLCASGDIDCRKFNLFYRLEADNTVYKVTSKNQ